MAKTKSKSEVLKQRGKKKETHIILFIFKWMTFVFILAGLMGIAGIFGLYSYLNQELPKINTLGDYHPPIVTNVFSDDGRKIGEFFEERRIVIPLSEMPKDLIDAFISAEDSRFREHPGIDILSIIRASLKNVQAGEIVQGGSTITQQVTKSFLLTPEKTYKRKLKEAILAYRIEKNFSKDEILFLYLNQIYLGHGAYGVESASENYFGKHAKDLTLAECSLLAGLPQAPSKYSPFSFPDKAKQRQIYVLNRMKEDNLITNLQATEAMNQKLDIKPRKNWFIESVPCYTEHVRRYVEKAYGKDALNRQGLQIHTAVNIEFQKYGTEAILQGLTELDRRIGYRGPLKTVSGLQIEQFCRDISENIGNSLLERNTPYQGVVTGVDDEHGLTRVRVGDFKGFIKFETMTWARKPDPELQDFEARVKKPSQVLKTGDVILVKLINDSAKNNEFEFTLDQEPNVESALLSIESETGHVKAMIGGRDYRNSQFNRAYQSRRQPGSAFKPIVYAAALDKGYTAASIIIDSPIVFEDPYSDNIWKPRNYGEKFYGPTLFREALAKSRNIVTIKILQDIGVDYVIDYAKKLGITSEIGRNLSIALGSSGVSLLELVNAYSVFSNLGYFIEPVFITKIEDRSGKMLESSQLIRKKVIDMGTAYIMTSLMESVIKIGTAKRIQALNRPAAGKTGTTNNLNDAWFIGYTPRYTTGVWVGYDQEASLGKGETGAKAAAPIWLEFMQKALEGKPVRSFTVPEGIVFARIDAKTGLLANENTKETIFECFKEGTVPAESSAKTDKESEAEDLYKEGI